MTSAQKKYPKLADKRDTFCGHRGERGSKILKVCSRHIWKPPKSFSNWGTTSWVAGNKLGVGCPSSLRCIQCKRIRRDGWQKHCTWLFTFQQRLRVIRVSDSIDSAGGLALHTTRWKATTSMGMCANARFTDSRGFVASVRGCTWKPGTVECRYHGLNLMPCNPKSTGGCSWLLPGISIKLLALGRDILISSVSCGADWDWHSITS